MCEQQRLICIALKQGETYTNEASNKVEKQLVNYRISLCGINHCQPRWAPLMKWKWVSTINVGIEVGFPKNPTLAPQHGVGVATAWAAPKYGGFTLWQWWRQRECLWATSGCRKKQVRDGLRLHRTQEVRTTSSPRQPMHNAF